MSTPTATPGDTSARPRSRSRARDESPPPQPTTPLRPPSRSSLRSSHGQSHVASTSENVHSNPLRGLEPAFAELSDGMADLEANLMHLQLMHESLSRFTECFASFLYGLNINAFCVDFPEAPVAESFRRALENPAFAEPAGQQQLLQHHESDPDQTFMTSDTSFVENPPVNSTKPSAVAAAASSTARASARGARGSTGRGTRGTAGRGTSARGGAAPSSSSRGASTASSTRGRASGLPRGTSGRGRAGGYR